MAGLEIASVAQRQIDAAGLWLPIYQPLIVGFGAVILTVLGNLILEATRQTRSDKRLAQMIRVMLLEELRVHERSFSSAVDRTSEKSGGDGAYLIPISERFPAYELMLKDLALLNEREVAAVVEAYSYLNALPEFMFPIGTFHRSEGRLYALVGGEFQDALLGISKNVLQKVSAAIGALSTSDTRAK